MHKAALLILGALQFTERYAAHEHNEQRAEIRSNAILFEHFDIALRAFERFC